MTTAKFFKGLTLLFILSAAEPALATIFTVDSLSDTIQSDGFCTLREAITAANTDTASGDCAAGSGSDEIRFGVAGSIKPNTALPTITTVIHINGYSAPGSSKNTLPLAQGTNAVLVIEIDGVNTGNVDGLRLQGAGVSGSIIEGLVINNSGNQTCCAQNGIFVSGVSGATTTYIRGNFIGTNSSGTLGAGKGSRGLAIWNGSTNFVVGSDTGGSFDPGSVNLISGNQLQNIILAGASNVRIRGNLVGTNAAGNAALTGSQDAVMIEDGINVQVIENVLSGNNGTGISLRSESSAIHIERNLIGVNASNSGALPNLNGGINISENPNGSPFIIQNVDLIENVVAFNTCIGGCSGGIRIGENNSANTVKGIRLTRNQVFSNQGLEIDLGITNANNNGLVYGVTDNDVGDPDDGANMLQNFPVVDSAAADGAHILVDYSFNSEASTAFTLEFFYTSTCDDSGHGGGELYLGKAEANTDSSGDVSDQILLVSNQVDGFITATATNQNNGTSEFSACLELANGIVFEDGFETPVP